MPIAYNKVLYPAQTEAVRLVDVKNHLRVDNDNEDALITILIQAATDMAELLTSRSFITQTRQMKLNYFPRYDVCGSINLQNGPLISLTGEDADQNDLGITYYDENETLQTLDTDDYWVDSSSNIPRVVVKNSWPGTFDMPNAVIITYTAGYGVSYDIPGPIKQAILLIVGHLYENRETVSSIEMYKVPFAAETLLSQYIVEQNVVY